MWAPRNSRYNSFAYVVAIANVDGLPGDSEFGVVTQYSSFLFAGRFASAIVGSASLLLIDSKDRVTTQFIAGQSGFQPHSLYAH